MTAKEAHNKSLWNQVKPQVREWIKESIEAGEFYHTLPENTTLNHQEQYALQELGYVIYFNKAFNSHEIRW
jgi:hypothetical protein